MRKNSSVTTQAATALLIAGLFLPSLSAQTEQRSSPLYRFRVTTDLVLVNVVVRDKKGEVVRGLTRDDFTLLEDGKPQSISSFDFEDVGAVPPSAPLPTTVLAAPSNAGIQARPETAATLSLHDRRLIVLFFDLSSMQPEEIDRAVTAAQDYVEKQMTPADLIAVVSLATFLRVDQDFTADRTRLKQVLQRFSSSSGQGFEEGATGDTEGTPDTGQPFTPDDTEYNIFNTDRRLEALQSLADALSRVDQKKSVIYFSSGMNRTGIENQAQLRVAINRAIRANVSLYAMDIRGLQALPPGGEAQQASLRGVAPFSGQATLNQFDSNFSSQETLVSLAADTGGRAFLDTNDFGAAFSRVQQDTSAYYVLGYRSNNPKHDGRFRRISVRTNLKRVKLEYRAGYYAPRDFAHSGREDRERQLVDELTSELPATDLNLYLAAAYFRLDDDRYFVPVSLVVPGWEIPFARASEKDRAALDVIGMVRDEAERPIGNVRDTVKLSLEGSQEVRRKNLQYQTGFILPSGKYHLKFVLRENQTGQMGAFETDLEIPDLRHLRLKMSAVVLSAQIKSGAKDKSENPLVRDGQELVPNITHVFSADQHLYLYYEVYDPEHESKDSQRAIIAGDKSRQGQGKPGIRVLTNIQFFRGKVKTYETSLVEARELTAPARRAAIFQLDVALTALRPGYYMCQVNVIDDAAGTFTFPRLPLLIRK
jgi:VWFA-related protein